MEVSRLCNSGEVITGTLGHSNELLPVIQIKNVTK